MKVNEIYPRYISGYRDYLPTLRNFGVSGLMLEIKNRGDIWTLKNFKKLETRSSANRTSISDVPQYTEICAAAASNPKILSVFKKCFEYRLVLEHVTRSQAIQYLEFIKHDQDVLSTITKVSKVEIGSPITYPFEGLGKLSPTQIRYGKILKDICNLFVDLHNFDIVEVGIGNGGLAAQIANQFELNSYRLVDLSEVLDLTRQTLRPFLELTTFEFIKPSEVSANATELFVSNYAFSELHKEVQDFYFENYIVHAKSGFMLYNHIHQNPDISHSAQDIADRIPGSLILKENPLTYEGNVLLVWGISPQADLKNFL
jgi:hypothetical protein